MKKPLLWILAITLFWLGILFISEFFGLDLLSGLSGLIFLFFFAYCSLILVVQAYSALAAFRSLPRRKAAGKRVSSEVIAEQKRPTILPEE